MVPSCQLKTEIQRLKNQIQDYQQDIQNLKGEVTKWSQYCAYVAGSSVGYSIHSHVCHP